MNCSKCEISKNCKHPALMGVGKKKARVMFVSDNPSEFEDEEGKWAVDNPGKLLIDLLESLDIKTSEECYFTGVIKCATPVDIKDNQRQPLSSEIGNCREIFEAELKVVNPDIIVPMGNVAVKLILGKIGITKYRGKAVEREDGKIIFPIVHPSLVFKQPKYAKNFTTDLSNLKLLMRSGMEFLKESVVDYRYLETESEVMEELERLYNEAEIISFDLETNSLSPYFSDSKIVCISLSDKDHYGVTIPLEHEDFEWTDEELKRIKDKLKWLMESDIPKLAQNGKFDMKWLLYKEGIDVKNFSFDTMIAHYIGVSEERGGHGLKSMAWEYTDMGGYDNKLDEYKKENGIEGDYSKIPWDILKEYAACDVDCPIRLKNKFQPILDSEEKWKDLFNLYMEASIALRDMENNGVKLDLDRLKEFQKAYDDRIKEIEERLRFYPEIVQIEREKLELFERRQLEMKKPKEERDEKILKFNKYKNFKFSFGSPVQLRELLFKKLGLDTPFRTDKGELSTGKETLEHLENRHPIVSLLSEWKKLEKLNGTYVSPASSWVGEDGLVHGTYNLVGTVTSRLASENPNMQNIPRKSNDPNSFQYKYAPKKLFVSRFGDEGVMLQYDYSQLELRVAAIFSKDPGLIGAYREGKDLHRYVASKVYKVTEDEVTSDMRTFAKTVSFGLLYGKGARSLAQDIGVSHEEAEEFISAYFKEFKGIEKWISDTKKQVKSKKYVETLAGFRRRLPAVDSNDRSIQADAMRQSINSPIQGTGANMTLKSIVLINKEFKKRNLKSVLAITVHDSIVADVFLPELETVYNLMKEIMENLPFDWITVPIVAEAEIGKDYGTMVEVDDIHEVLGYEGGVLAWIDNQLDIKYKKASGEN